MTGPDEKQDEVTFKVTDRRKFNPDGSLKEGMHLEEKKPPARAFEGARTPTEAAQMPHVQPRSVDSRETGPEPSDNEIPGADDPASFVNFLSTLATNAVAALGGVPHPSTGRRSVDLETGKYWLDILAMLRDKTQGNLHPQESRLLEDLLADLRMQYVAMVRATEEKLKSQAAKKFSAADILGKK